MLCSTSILSFCVFLLRSFVIAAFCVIGGALGIHYVTAFICTDLNFFLLVKIVRGDFLYWISIEGLIAYPLALFVRIMFKIITDFTAILQLRHHQELGGIVFSLNVLVSLACLFPS